MEPAVTSHSELEGTPPAPRKDVLFLHSSCSPVIDEIRSDAVIILLCLILAATIRLDFLSAGKFVIDADEAIVGLMAKHVLEGGAIPTFYYGQHYMGSLEPLLVSASFALFGISNFTMQLIPFCFSLLVVVVLYLIGHEIGGRFVGRVSALLGAVPPVTLVVWSSKPRGGFIEVVFLGALAIFLTLRWIKASNPSSAMTIWIGLTLGLGWWVNNQILYFMLPIGFMMAATLISSEDSVSAIRRLIALVRHGLLGTLAFIVGGSPFWIYQVENDFASFGLFGSSTMKEILDHAEGLVDTALPILIGAKHSWQITDIFPGSSLIYGTVYGFLIFLVLWWRRGALARLCILRVDRRRPVELLFLFLVSGSAVFVISSFGWLVQAPRYLLPLYVGIFPLTALGIYRVWRWTPIGATAVISCVLGFSLYSSYGNGRALPGEPVVFNGERVSKDHAELITWLYDQKIRWVRTNYWIGYRLAFETGERVKFQVVHEPRTDRIPAYREASKEIPKNSMPLILVPSQAVLTKRALAKLGYHFNEVRKSDYVVLYDILADHPTTHEVPSSAVMIESNRNQSMVSLAIDGSEDTRWGTAEPQNPGEQVVVTFEPSQVLQGFHYSEGRWTSDYPRGLSIEAETPDGTRSSILKPEDYVAIRYHLDEAGEWKFYFPPLEVKRLVMTQSGKHPVFDWSIAEIRFLSPTLSEPAS